MDFQFPSPFSWLKLCRDFDRLNASTMTSLEDFRKQKLSRCHLRLSRWFVAAHDGLKALEHRTTYKMHIYFGSKWPPSLLRSKRGVWELPILVECGDLSCKKKCEGRNGRSGWNFVVIVFFCWMLTKKPEQNDSNEGTDLDKRSADIMPMNLLQIQEISFTKSMKAWVTKISDGNGPIHGHGSATFCHFTRHSSAWFFYWWSSACSSSSTIFSRTTKKRGKRWKIEWLPKYIITKILKIPVQLWWKDDDRSIVYRFSFSIHAAFSKLGQRNNLKSNNGPWDKNEYLKH